MEEGTREIYGGEHCHHRVNRCSLQSTLRYGGYCNVVDISKAGQHLAPTGYVAETCPNRLAQAKKYFRDDALPGKVWFSASVSLRPELLRFKAAGMEEARATAASSEAVEKYFATRTSVPRQYEITSDAQDFNTDKSMINTAEVLSSCSKHMYTTSPSRRRADFVTPAVQSGPEAASLVACIYADGFACRSLRLCAAVVGSCRTSRRLPLTITQPRYRWRPTWASALRPTGGTTLDLTGSYRLSTHGSWLRIWGPLNQLKVDVPH